MTEHVALPDFISQGGYWNLVCKIGEGVAVRALVESQGINYFVHADLYIAFDQCICEYTHGYSPIANISKYQKLPNQLP